MRVAKSGVPGQVIDSLGKGGAVKKRTAIAGRTCTNGRATWDDEARGRTNEKNGTVPLLSSLGRAGFSDPFVYVGMICCLRKPQGGGGSGRTLDELSRL